MKAAKETSQLAQKLLTYERAKSINPVSAKESFSINELLDGLVQEYRQKDLGNVQIVFNPAQTDASLSGDRTMIREAVSNLIDNALKHGGSDLKGIDVTAERGGINLVVTVKDDGRGLDESEIKTALQRFGQVSEDGEGSGLGLPIVARVAERHNGTLTLSGNNPGLRAQIDLPL